LKRLQQIESVGSSNTLSDNAVRYYEGLKWDLDQMQQVLTPRVVTTATNQQLVDRMVEFDDARRALHHAIIAHQQAITGGGFVKLVALIESASRLYSEVYGLSAVSNAGRVAQ
jgi:hypothetical protein